MKQWKKVNRDEDVREERFSISQISQAIGRSEGSITGFCSRSGIQTKGGLTIDQIIECIEAPVNGKSMNWDKVARIEELLKQRGYEELEEEERYEQGTFNWQTDKRS